MSDQKEELEKLVQEKLAECSKLLEECTRLAEKGGFEFTFYSPGETYYPATLNLFSEDDVMERLRDSVGDELDSYTPDELKESLEEVREEMLAEELPEYAELGHWWMPSRNC